MKKTVILIVAIVLSACSGGQQNTFGASPAFRPQLVSRQNPSFTARSTAPPAGYVFPDELSAGPVGAHGFNTLYTFGSGTDAAGVQAKMVNIGGTLYGTSHGGGTMGFGTVFTYNPHTNVEQVLYSFKGGTDGWGPEALLTNVNGTLYGTTAALPEPGFPDGQGNGTVFSITKSGAETPLHNFGGSPDGANPEGFVIEVNGLLYGTTFVGGTGTCTYSSSTGCGTVFTVDPTTGAETVIHSFQGGADGAGPRAGLIDVNGTLYGSTYFGGTSNMGTVYSITPSGTEAVLHSFTGGSTDGDTPQSALTLINGVLYGTTNRGGTTGYGITYSITTTGTEAVVAATCCGPEGGVIGYEGVLYGTASGNGSGSAGCVYRLTTTGTRLVLHSFTGGTNGGSPEDALAVIDGVLYGTTRLAGANGVGTIFKVTP